MRNSYPVTEKERKQKKRLLLSIVLFTVLLIVSIIMTVVILNYPMVYSGVYLDGIHLGGLSKDELADYIQKKYDLDMENMEVNIFHRDYQLRVNFRELNVIVNSQSMFNQVYNAGRKGNILQRLYTIYSLQKNHLYLETDLFIDMNILERVVSDIYTKTHTPSGPPSLMILDDGVYINSGTYGYAVDRDKLKERIIQQVKKLKPGIVIVPVEEIVPPRIDIDEFYNQIVQQPQDASISIVDGEIYITPEVVGRSLDKAAFLSSIAELEAKSSKYPYRQKLPVDFIQPELTQETITKSLFKDELANYSASFPVKTENDRARANNIRLAVEAIDGTILLPGGTFSFNETVGKRTIEKGYKKANIYTAEGIATGTGGGVCQVSSALYNAALLANLQIDERNPHIYVVTYVPLGQDAAVSYGTEDFRFTNNTGWPVKITGKVSKDQLRFTIIGTKENPSLTVHVQSYILKTIPYTTVYEDENVTKGAGVIVQDGMDGAVVDTYITIRSEDKVIDSYKLHTTTYRPLPEIIR